MTRATGMEEERRPSLIDDEGSREFRFSVDLMSRMDELGLFPNDGVGIELRRGKLIRMAPVGIDHGDSDGFLQRELWSLIRALGDKELKVVTATLLLSDDEAPQVDGMVVKGRPAGRYYTPREVRLVVEVGVSTLQADLREKRDAYAAAGVIEYWVIDPVGRTLHMFRAPEHGAYAEHDLRKPGDRVSPMFAKGRGDIAVADLF